ncbi:hypothetical protein V3C99_002950 [Haemonchus contortus]|uniref:PAX-interacting protein 1 n=1 Tax=Haemonchus contortus TaxID=6289 RepID=A0A7I4Y8D5_HAECO|nr:uncharacterized protein LOC100883693 [Haemonchus contortus]
MSEPESRLPTPGRIPPGTTTVGALPPLTLPPPRLDPLAGISSVHHSYASPSLGTQMMPSPILQSGMMSPVSAQSPISHQMVSPQQKSQPVSLAGGQVPQQQHLQDLRRQSINMMHPQEQMRGQFSHTVTTVPSNKRPNEMGRQIQSVPSSPASLAVSTPPQSVQARHGSLDAQPSPGSGSVGNPSPSYSNHSSPSVVQLHNGHGPPSSYVQSSTMHSHGVQPAARFSSIPSQDHLQHQVTIGSLSSGTNKQVFQHDVMSRPVGTPLVAASPQQRSIAAAPQLPQPPSSQTPSLLQQQLCSRPSRVSSHAAAAPGGQSNVLIQQQPLPQISVGPTQQNGQQCNPKPRAIPSQETLSRQLQSTSSAQQQQQQQHVVMGLLHGAQLQQQQADGVAGYGCANVSNPHVRQILASRTPQVLTGPPGPGPSSAQHVVASLPQTSSPPRMSPSTLQQQVVVPHGILPSQANLPLRSVLAAQHQLSQQQLLQQQRQPPQVQVQQAQPQQPLRLAGRMVGTASGALATLYDTEKSAPALTNKDAYRMLKRRFKYLVYENECYQEELRNLQRKLLKLSRDKNFLLDRLGQFEKFSESSDEDSDASNKTCDEKPKPKKRIRPSQRKRAADESGEGTSVVKRAVEESNASSPSPSESPILDPRSTAFVSAAPAQQTMQPYKHQTNPMAAPCERMTGSYTVTSQGIAGAQPQQQVLRSTLARVVPSTMLAQQQSVQQPQSSSSRAVVDTRPIMAKVRVESTSLTSAPTVYQSEQQRQAPLPKKGVPRDSHSAQPPSTEFTQTSQEGLSRNPLNGDDHTPSSMDVLGPSVSMAPAPLDPCRSAHPGPSMSSYPMLNGLLPEASNVVDCKEESNAGTILTPTTSQYR